MNKITKTITLLSLFPLQSVIGTEQDNFDQRPNKRDQSHIVSDRVRTSVSLPMIKRERLNDAIELPKATNYTQRSVLSHLEIHPLYEMCSPATNAEQFANSLVDIHQRDLLPILSISPSRTVIAGYKKFLRDKLKNRDDVNPEAIDTLINNILPSFKDMYSGIVRPYIIIAIEAKLNINTGLLYQG